MKLILKIVGIVIVVVSVLTLLTILNIIPRNKSLEEIENDKCRQSLPIKELESSLRNIPDNRLFIYDNRIKIPLLRKQNKCGYTYFLVNGNPEAMISSPTLLLIGFKENLSEEKIEEIIQTEKLKINKDETHTTYLITKDSKFSNSIEESTYLIDKYPEIDYASPDTKATMGDTAKKKYKSINPDLEN